MKKIIVYFLFFGSLLACQNKTTDKVATVSNSDVRDITMGEALVKMKTEGVVTIDIRTPEEVSAGKILNTAIELDYYADTFKADIEKLNRETSYVLYCRSGGRSGKTLKMMEQLGFKNAYNVLGGYNKYKSEYGTEPLK